MIRYVDIPDTKAKLAKAKAIPGVRAASEMSQDNVPGQSALSQDKPQVSQDTTAWPGSPSCPCACCELRRKKEAGRKAKARAKT